MAFRRRSFRRGRAGGRRRFGRGRMRRGRGRFRGRRRSRGSGMRRLLKIGYRM